MHDTIAFYSFISPWLLGFLIFTLGPMLISFYMSFTDWDVFTSPKWIGLANYRDIFLDDDIFWKALWNTFFMGVFGLPLSIILGFAVAYLLYQKVRGLYTFRTLFYLPNVVPVVASAMLWLWIFQPHVGLASSFCRMFLHTEGPGWFRSALWAKPTMIIMGLWGVGGGMIIYLAGLQGIPEYLYEAADIDGANSWQKMLHVTIPMMSPVLFFNLIMGAIGTFQMFTESYIMTGGGPDNATMFYAFYLFKIAFEHFEMGYASALAWILFVMVLIITYLQFVLLGKKVHYE